MNLIAQLQQIPERIVDYNIPFCKCGDRQTQIQILEQNATQSAPTT